MEGIALLSDSTSTVKTMNDELLEILRSKGSHVLLRGVAESVNDSFASIPRTRQIGRTHSAARLQK
jgi:hypothetical protein